MLRVRRSAVRRGSSILSRVWMAVAAAMIALFAALPVSEAFAHCDETETSSCPDDRSCQCPAQCACGCGQLATGDFPAPIAQVPRVLLERLVDWTPTLDAGPPDPAPLRALKVPISLA